MHTMIEQKYIFHWSVYYQFNVHLVKIRKLNIYNFIYEI